MQLDIYNEIKKALKDGLSEWYEENKNKLSFSSQSDEKGNSLLTIKQFCAKYPFISEAGLRSRLYNREYNKFNLCCSKSGRRIFIKEKEAIEWFANPPPEHEWTYERKKYGHN